MRVGIFACWEGEAGVIYSDPGRCARAADPGVRVRVPWSRSHLFFAAASFLQLCPARRRRSRCRCLRGCLLDCLRRLMSLLAVRACCAATPNPSSYPVLLAYASSPRLLGLVSQCAASFRSLLYSLGLGIVCLSLCLVYPSRITPLNVYAPSSPRPFHQIGRAHV